MAAGRTIQTRVSSPTARPMRAITFRRPIDGTVTYPAMSGGGGTPLSVAYPSAIDSPPSFVDESAVLSAIWLNFLSEIVESVEAEIGELGNQLTDQTKWIAGKSNLAAMLNYLHTSSSRIKGVTKVTISKIGTAYAAVARTSITPPDSNSSSDPIVFGTSLLHSGISISDWEDGPAMVRGRAFTNTPYLSIDYLGSRIGYAEGSGSQGGLHPGPTSTKTFRTELLIFSM